MGIREDSKKIAQRMLDTACDNGSFKKYYAFNRKEFGILLNVTGMRFNLCCEYLEAHDCIERKPDAEPGEIAYKVNPTIVDFLECDGSVS